MKKALLLFFLIFYLSFGWSQSTIFSKGFVGQNSASVNTCLGLPNGSWLLGGQGHACYGYPNLFKLKANGDTAWTATQFLVAWISDLSYANGKIYTAGRMGCACVVKDRIECSQGCGFGNWGLAVQQLDTNGNAAASNGVIYANYQPNVSGFDPQMPVRVLAIDETHVLLSYADSLYCFNTTIVDSYQQWLVAWRLTVQGNINNMATNGKDVFLATDSGTQKIDTTGHLLVTEPHGNVTGIYTANGLDVYALADGNLLRMDSGLQVLDSINLSLNHYQIQGIRSNGADLVVLLQTDNSLTYVAIVTDTALTSPQTITLTNQCNAAVDFDVNDTTMLLVGNDSIQMSGMPDFPNIPNKLMTNSIYASTYSLHGALPPAPLQAVLYDASIDSSHISNSNYFPTLYINYAVYLTNTSNDTITSAAIATDEGVAIYDCAQGPSGVVFNNLHVAPGDSVKLAGIDFAYPELLGIPASIQQRFYLTAINGNRVGGSCSIDSIASPIYLYNGIETLPNNKGVSVYPNPANDAVTITFQAWTGKQAQLTLTDLNGRQILTQSLNQTQQTIDISQLPQGIYVYSIKYGDGQQVMGKICKL